MNRYPQLDVWCDTCGTKWLVPSTTADGDLHVFHDRNLANHVALNVYEDTFLDQVVGFIEEVYGAGSVRSGTINNVHTVLSEVADRDETGGKFRVLKDMSCPVCAAKRLAFRPNDLSRYTTEELPPLKHERWSTLSELERAAEVKLAIKGVKAEWH